MLAQPLKQKTSRFLINLVLVLRVAHSTKTIQAVGLTKQERAREHLQQQQQQQLHPDGQVGGRFSLDDVRSRLHGQLEIQPVSQQPTSSLPPHWSSLDGRHQVSLIAFL